jgi:hypothetical protein
MFSWVCIGMSYCMPKIVVYIKTRSSSVHEPTQVLPMLIVPLHAARTLLGYRPILALMELLFLVEPHCLAILWHLLQRWHLQERQNYTQ